MNLPQHASDFYDFEMINEVKHDCSNISSVISEIDEVLKLFPWKISTLALAELNWMRDMVRVTEIDIDKSICDLTNGG